MGGVLLVVVLAAQHGWFQRDRYLAQPELQPWILLACERLPCQAQAPPDPAALSTNSLIVRSHPELEGALRIDAILRNAGAEQAPFPGLELRFVNITGGLVARRLFVPREYLHGEMRGLRHVPAQTEVRLAFEIMDPGENAVGYSLAVIQ